MFEGSNVQGLENQRPQAAKHTARTGQQDAVCQDIRVFAGSRGQVFTTLPCFNFLLPILILLKSEPMAASRVGLRDCLGCGYSVPAKPFTETDLIQRADTRPAAFIHWTGA